MKGKRIEPMVLNRAQYKLTLSAFEYSAGANGKGELKYGLAGNYTVGVIFTGHWWLTSGLCDCDIVAQIRHKLEVENATDITGKNIDNVLSGINHDPSRRIYSKTGFQWPLEPSGLIADAWINIDDDQDIIPISKDLMDCLPDIDRLWRTDGDYGILYLVDKDNWPVFGVAPINMKGE